MSRKKRRSRDKPSSPAFTSPPGSGPSVFGVGDRVRVKVGTHDPDFPDFPLGGWAGTIREIDAESQPRLCHVVWTDKTRQAVHPVYEQRRERDGLDIDSIWLTEDCLVPDPGGPVVMEIPGELIPRPLRAFEQEDRIRAILGLTSDDPLPEAGEKELRRYHAYLQEQLSFPFNAEIWVQAGPFSGQMRPITVYRLLRIEEGGTEGNGLLIEGSLGEDRAIAPLSELETGADSPNRRLLQDYSYWYCEFGDGSGGAGLFDEEEEPTTLAGVLRSGLRYSVYGMGFGAVLGALLATQEWAVQALMVGGAIGAVMGWMLGSRYGLIFGSVNRVRGGPMVGGLLGSLAGALAVGSLGVLLAGCLGTIPGSIAGNVLGKILGRFRIRPWTSMVWSLIGACAGGMLLALLWNWEDGVNGSLTGALVGGAATAGLFLFVVVVLGLMISSKE